jgi:hypothetical protein
MNQPWSSLAVPPDAIIVAQNGSPSALATDDGLHRIGFDALELAFRSRLSQLHTTLPCATGMASSVATDLAPDAFAPRCP